MLNEIKKTEKYWKKTGKISQVHQLAVLKQLYNNDEEV
jgi:hypothetical protein